MGVEVEPAPPSIPALATGRMLAGRYRLHSILGEGGMAIVYEGEHVAIGKRVAIKLVQSLFARDDEIVSRFEREARTASAVESEHIVHVFDVGADPELGLFLVMELLKGEDLGHVLARRSRIDPVFACGLVKQAALGLEKAHAAGIVHRDLKPANVFLVERDDGTTLVKLVDFGIAKVVREAHDARFARKGITRRGTAIGTPQYMSPEQAQGLETVDHRTDVFALGAVLFECIAGRPCFEERPTYEQTILHLVSTTAPRLSTFAPDIPEALDDLVAGMLAHDIEQRVPSMRVVRERLEGIFPELQGSSVKLRSLPPPSLPSFGRYVAQPSPAPLESTLPRGVVPGLNRRRQVFWAVGAFAAVTGVALGLLGVVPVRSTKPTTSLAAPVTDIAKSPPSTAPSAPPAVPSQAPAVDPSPSTSAAAPAVPSSAAPPRSHKSPPHAPPREQVGAAGISNQF